MSLAKRVIGRLLAVVLLVAIAIPAKSAEPATAMTLADGISLSGDFRGNGRSQIASLYDPQDDLGLRIVVLEKSPTADQFTHTQWLISGPNSFDLSRMKVVATDANFDGRTDLVALYDDGGTTVRLIVFTSTGSSFVYAGVWWQSSGYAWSRVREVLSGNFSAVGNNGLLFVYQYDNFQMRIHYLESDGGKFIYNGDGGVYDSGPGQYDTARAKFVIGRFTRDSGSDQLASIYQYSNFRIRTHVFDPTPNGLQPVNGWDGVYDSGEGQYDLSRMKIAATDMDADGRADIASLYSYSNGSVRVHGFSGARSLQPFDSATTVEAGAAAWSRTRVVGGDWDGNKKGDLATLEARDDGTTHAMLLRSNGASFDVIKDAWVTPANEVQRIACAEECWPLTGQAHNGGAVGRRGINVRIDNSPAARPHYGISEADMVFELLVEGRITRLSAILHSQNPGTIGSVRSGRLSDRYLTPMVRGGLAYSGATVEETDAFQRDALAGGYVDLNANYTSGYYRVSTRPSPYNLFTSSDALRSALNEKGASAAVSIPRWDFLRSATHSATAGGFVGSGFATEITIPYRERATVRYGYNAETKTYARWQDNGAGSMVREVDAANGVAIAASNVIVIHTEIWETNIIQDIFGSRGLDMRLEGLGQATVFRDGRRQDGTWSRGTIYDPFVFTSQSGERIHLSPGQTWVHVIPDGWQVPSN